MLVRLNHLNPNIRYTSTEKHLKFMVKFYENEEKCRYSPLVMCLNKQYIMNKAMKL